MDDSDPSILFKCKCDSAKVIFGLLSSLRDVSPSSSGPPSDDLANSSFPSIDKSAKAQLTTVYVTDESLAFFVYGVAKVSQASVTIQSTVFSRYYVRRERRDEGEDSPPSDSQEEAAGGGEFTVDLTTVVNCISVLGTANLASTKIEMEYDDETHLLRITLEEGGIMSTAAIFGSAAHDDLVAAAYDDDDDDDDDADPSFRGRPHSAASSISQGHLSTAFYAEPTVATHILKSSVLHDCFLEIQDVPTSQVVTLRLSPTGLSLSTSCPATGHSVSVQVPKHKDLYTTLENSPAITHARRYSKALLVAGLKALDIGSLTALHLNRDGILAIQHQVVDGLRFGRPHFVDYLIMCRAEEEEEEDRERDDEMREIREAKEGRDKVAKRKIGSAANSLAKSVEDEEKPPSSNKKGWRKRRDPRLDHRNHDDEDDDNDNDNENDGNNNSSSHNDDDDERRGGGEENGWDGDDDGAADDEDDNDNDDDDDEEEEEEVVKQAKPRKNRPDRMEAYGKHATGRRGRNSPNSSDDHAQRQMSSSLDLGQNSVDDDSTTEDDDEVMEMHRRPQNASLASRRVLMSAASSQSDAGGAEGSRGGGGGGEQHLSRKPAKEGVAWSQQTEVRGLEPGQKGKPVPQVGRGGGAPPTNTYSDDEDTEEDEVF